MKPTVLTLSITENGEATVATNLEDGLPTAEMDGRLRLLIHACLQLAQAYMERRAQLWLQVRETAVQGDNDET